MDAGAEPGPPSGMAADGVPLQLRKGGLPSDDAVPGGTGGGPERAVELLQV